MGKLEFQATAECVTDAVKVSARITAVAQATFAANANATYIIFNTAHDCGVAERFRFTSQNEIGIAGANYGTDGQVLTSGGAGAAAAWEDAGGGAVSAINNATANELVTIGATTTELCAEANLTFDGTGQFAFVNSATCSSTDFKVHSSAESGATPARLILRTGCGNTADTFISFHGVCTYEYAMGVDNSDSDKFKISGSALGTNDKFIIDTTGAVSKPLQPAMLAYNSATDSNVSGNCTVVTIDFDTELYDQNADFASDVFTAPVTGRYLVAGHVAVIGITDASRNTDLEIDETDRDYHTIQNTYGDSGGGRQSFPFSTIIPMDSGNTVRIKYGASCEGSDVHDIVGEASDNQTYLSIQLLA